MKKILLIILSIVILIILLLIMVEQYNKYALKIATIKLVKEYCNEDIEVRNVNIQRISFNWLNGRYPKWEVKTVPSNYNLSGYIDNGFIPKRAWGCYLNIDIPLKLDRFKREFVPKQNTL